MHVHVVAPLSGLDENASVTSHLTRASVTADLSFSFLRIEK